MTNIMSVSTFMFGFHKSLSKEKTEHEHFGFIKPHVGQKAGQTVALHTQLN